MVRGSSGTSVGWDKPACGPDRSIPAATATGKNLRLNISVLLLWPLSLSVIQAIFSAGHM
jgi:hypothetical protein